MAYSTSDIPAEFLSLSARRSFIAWLQRVPASHSRKKRMLISWAKHLNYKLTELDYRFALTTQQPESSYAE